MSSDDKEERDEEGLLLKYDIIICGTGLVQSILASALSRAGKSVLHCDEKGYYGERDAVLTLPYVLEGNVWSNGKDEPVSDCNVTPDRISLKEPEMKLHSTECLTSVPIEYGLDVSTPFGKGKVMSQSSNSSLPISLTEWTLADGSNPTLFVGVPEDDAESLESYLASSKNIHSLLLTESKLLLKHSSRSFAFDISPSLIFGSGISVDGFLKSGVAGYLEFKSIEGLFWFDTGEVSRVPCSKGDVFASKLLKPLEKRKLMKFMQLVMDYGTSQQAAAHDEVDEGKTVSAEEEVQSLNERQLNQGRSLSRPQNKAVSSDDLRILEDIIEANDADFEAYLSGTLKLSRSLKSLMRYALALETSPDSVSLKEGMKRLCDHFQGLGQFGATAFLAPMFGGGEFAQSFCRSAAVHGATYLLRRAPRSVVVKQGRVSGIELANAEGSKAGNKFVSSDHVVVSSHRLPVPTKKRVLRRISIVRGTVGVDDAEQRHVIIIPPGSSLGNSSSIHCLVMDASLKVAPPMSTLLHLTSTVNSEEFDKTLMERTAKDLLGDNGTEIYHVEFSYPLPDYSPADATFDAEGLHVCHQRGPSLVAGGAFENAKEIFETICPGQEFLGLSEKVEEMIKERMLDRDEDDGERDVLDKAVDMLDAQSSNADEAKTESTPEAKGNETNTGSTQ